MLSYRQRRLVIAMIEDSARRMFRFASLCLCLIAVSPAISKSTPLKTEKLKGEGVWVQPTLAQRADFRQARVTVWFDEQLLGDGKAYLRRAKGFRGRHRRELRTAAMSTLKALADRSYEAAASDLKKLSRNKEIRELERHWIINGFSCSVTPRGLAALQTVPGVKKIFEIGLPRSRSGPGRTQGPAFTAVPREKFDAKRYNHPWYIRNLLADKVWEEFGITGKGTLNVVHDFNFVFSDNTTYNLYRNPKEKPGNGKDDDGNGLVDDYHGYNFANNSPQLTLQSVALDAKRPKQMHGFMCAAIICAAGVPGAQNEFGIAPEASWAAVIGGSRIEAAIEWAIEQQADTYSMSFSLPGMGEYRSHWRKIMEHGSLCGVYFVSGAGNFAQQVGVPVQMRLPEDIPEVVFAAAGVQRNLSRAVFSSKGPVRWDTEHYSDGLVLKPEVCAFNMALPFLKRDGAVVPAAINGNSFAGPMFCGAIALMLSADPDILPWDLKEVITLTAMDVGPQGIDDETGAGLINCYRAVKEVLRRKAVREGEDPGPFEGRHAGDTLKLESVDE